MFDPSTIANNLEYESLKLSKSHYVSKYELWSQKYSSSSNRQQPKFIMCKYIIYIFKKILQTQTKINQI